MDSDNFSHDCPSLNIDLNIDIQQSLLLPTNNEKNSSVSHLEERFFEIESTTTDNFILKSNSYDDYCSDSEITSNQDARKMNSEFDIDYTDDDETEINTVM